MRIAANLSQEALAREAGLSASLVAKLEMGRVRSPSVETVVRIARVLGRRLGEPVSTVMIKLMEGLDDEG